MTFSTVNRSIKRIRTLREFVKYRQQVNIFFMCNKNVLRFHAVRTRRCGGSSSSIRSMIYAPNILILYHGSDLLAVTVAFRWLWSSYSVSQLPTLEYLYKYLDHRSYMKYNAVLNMIYYYLLRNVHPIYTILLPQSKMFIH